MTNARFQHPRRNNPRDWFVPPRIVHQRYTLDQVIGVGGHACVYRAWDLQQGTQVVLKRAHVHISATQALSAEAETLARLHHPAIPTFVASFEEAGFSYLVEALREGTAMKHLRHFTLEHVLWIGHHLCDVLAYLHQQQVVHRDIAPGNILLQMENQCLSLLDFGLACPEPGGYLDDASSSGVALTAGSPGYVAPEQWELGAISRACDIYGMGMVLGCALTDCQPGIATKVSSFVELRENPHGISPEERQLLLLLDRMVLAHPAERPDLSEVQFFFSHLSGLMLGTD